jgi:tetratricopeptide (TPR) repeat protein
MASERQIQDKRESTQEDSIENGAAQQELADRAKAKKKAEKSPKSVSSGPKNAVINSDSKDDDAKKLASLTATLQGDLSSIDPDAALKTIDELYGLVHQSKQPQAKEIASGLKELQKLLKRKEPSGHELGELIGHLGEQTSEIAADAEKAIKTPIQHLGKQLTKIGRSLSKAEDLEHLEALDALMDILEQKPDKIDSKHTVGEIDRWHDILHKSEDESLKAIATELKALKQLLKGTKTKSADLGEQLIQLGEHTMTAATNAGRGFKGVIQKLGKVLIAFGKSLV